MKTLLNIVRHTAVVLIPLAALALVPVALDWRSPILCSMRRYALVGLITVSLGLILAEIWVLRFSKPTERVLKVLSWVGLIAAILVITLTVTLEARHYWFRQQVLQADPHRLERLGRHVILGYRDLSEIQRLISLRGVAGVFLTTHNVRDKSITEIRKEIDFLQRIRREQGLPLLWIATDQEGGIVSRMSPPLPYQPALSEIVRDCPDRDQLRDAVRHYARKQGQGLARVGVNLNFAPVVDLNHQIVNPDDRFTRIHERAISHDPAIVAQVAGWYCGALEETGVQCTLKHFPGLGRVFNDTHKLQADLATSVEDLAGSDWIPFRTLMRRGHVFTMLGHARLTSVDPDHPVSLSPAVIANIIRGEWNYDGILITDNLTMLAVYQSSLGIDNGSIQALNAGVDLILISWDVDQYYRVMYALLQADRLGRLNWEVLQQSDRRLARSVRHTQHHRGTH
jgi:beta-N-acetylhexosaminidase